MRALLQRVSRASVNVGGKETGAIGSGLVVLLGIKRGDGEDDAKKLATKIIELRVFPDEKHAINRSLKDARGEILLISQFTLYADCRKGRRPSFDLAAKPPEAEALYRFFARELEKSGFKPQEGMFGAHMAVSLVGDGPVTIMLESA